MNSGIYKITCIDNGHYYYGRSTNFESRKKDHLKELRRGVHKNSRMQNCYNKYGEPSLIFELVNPISDKAEQISCEQELIDAHIDNADCMNLNRSAKTGCDVPWTEERKRKISLANTGRKYRPLSKEACEARSLRMLGNRLSNETKRKISLAHVGKRYSDEHKREISERTAGENNPNFGKVGELNPNSIPIYQIEIGSLNIVQEFASASDAQRITSYDGSSISKVCRGKKKQAYGYLWCYKHEHEDSHHRLIENSDYITGKRHIKCGKDNPMAKPVVQLSKDGEMIREYDYVSQVKEYGFNPSSVIGICKGKGKSAHGFVWRYKESVTTIESVECTA